MTLSVVIPAHNAARHAGCHARQPAGADGVATGSNHRRRRLARCDAADRPGLHRARQALLAARQRWRARGRLGGAQPRHRGGDRALADVPRRRRHHRRHLRRPDGRQARGHSRCQGRRSGSIRITASCRRGRRGSRLRSRARPSRPWRGPSSRRPWRGADRALVVEQGGFDARLRTAEDMDFFQRIARTGTAFLAVPEPLALYHMRRGSLSTDARAMLADGTARHRTRVRYRSARRPSVRASRRRRRSSGGIEGNGAGRERAVVRRGRCRPGRRRRLPADAPARPPRRSRRALPADHRRGPWCSAPSDCPTSCRTRIPPSSAVSARCCTRSSASSRRRGLPSACALPWSPRSSARTA